MFNIFFICKLRYSILKLNIMAHLYPPKGRQVPSLKHDSESWVPALVVYRRFGNKIRGK